MHDQLVNLGFSAELSTELAAAGQLETFGAGKLIVDVNDPVLHIPIILSGAIRILRVDDDGAELLLYYIEAGETCAATLNCCLERARSAIRAIAELDTQILFVPHTKLSSWMATYPEWQTFVMRSFTERFDELLAAVDALAFGSLGERLLHLLREKAAFQNSSHIDVTHRQLAADLNSSRVVISRLLKKLELEGQLQISRNRITLRSN